MLKKCFYTPGWMEDSTSAPPLLFFIHPLFLVPAANHLSITRNPPGIPLICRNPLSSLLRSDKMSSVFPPRKLALLHSAELRLPPLIHAWTLGGGVEKKTKNRKKQKYVKRELHLNKLHLNKKKKRRRSSER